MRSSKDVARLYAEAVVQFVNASSPQKAYLQFLESLAHAFKEDFNHDFKPINEEIFVSYYSYKEKDDDIDFSIWAESISQLQEGYKKILIDFNLTGLKIKTEKGYEKAYIVHEVIIDVETGHEFPPFDGGKYILNGKPILCDDEDLDEDLYYCLQRSFSKDREIRHKIRRCPICNRFFVAKNKQRTFCYKIECIRAYEREKKAKQRDKDPVKYV